MTHDVFISYASKDKILADAVCATLEGRRIRCWIAPRDIMPGMDWSDAIIDALTSAQVFVLLLSETWQDENERMVADRETGYPIYRVAACEATEGFLAAVHAYNDTMKEWHERHK